MQRERREGVRARVFIRSLQCNKFSNAICTIYVEDTSCSFVTKKTVRRVLNKFIRYIDACIACTHRSIADNHKCMEHSFDCQACNYIYVNFSLSKIIR